MQIVPPVSHMLSVWFAAAERGAAYRHEAVNGLPSHVNVGVGQQVGKSRQAALHVKTYTHSTQA